tara:strand:- start:2162 stop:3424 length:1263 start_codon:yes stop_codon:yes gene_type:complete
MFDKKYDAEELASIYKSVYEKKLDPVGQEDKDIDNDGDHDKSDKYLLNRRKVRSDAIKSGMHRDAKTGKESMKNPHSESVEVEEGYKEISFDKHQKMYNRYKNLSKAAMKDARDSGEASGDNRRKMGKMMPVINKSSENLRKKQTKGELTGRGPRKEEVELDENRRAARSAGGYKDDSKKQPDPSKDGFTGIGNMSIDAIRKMSARIEKEKTKKEEVEVVDEGSMKKARENVGASTCWDGYKAKGTKKKNGREVPNCVKEEEELEEDKKELSREKRNKMFRRAGNLSREALQGGDKGSEAHKKSGKIVKALNKDAEENNRNDVREETLRDIYEGKKKGLWDNIHAKRKRGEKPAKPGDEDYPKTLKIESNEKLEEAAPALVGVLAKMAAKKAAVHVAKKGAEKVKDKMGKLLKGDEEEEG